MCGKIKPNKVSKRDQVGRKLDPDNANAATQNTEEDRRAMAADALQKRLNQGSSSSRMTHSAKNIFERARRELMEEKKREKINLATEEVPVEEPREKTTVLLYTCDMLGEDVALPKAQLKEAIEKQIRRKMQDEALKYSLLLMNFLSTEPKREAAMAIIKKYLENVFSDLNELKFRRIKSSNKVFMEKVASVEGAVVFLKSVGFEEQQVRNEQSGELDSFLVLDEPNSSLIQYALLLLGDEMSVKISFFRDPKVFIFNPNEPIQEQTIPDDFYELLPDELKAMRLQKSQELDKSTTLRTRKMREQEEGKANPAVVYNKCFIRIRFPDNYILQGEFRPHETLSDVHDFVKKSLENPTEAFNLFFPGRELLSTRKTLLESGLVPLATLHFAWKSTQKDSEYLSMHWKNQSTQLAQA